MGYNLCNFFNSREANAAHISVSDTDHVLCVDRGCSSDKKVRHDGCSLFSPLDYSPHIRCFRGQRDWQWYVQFVY